MKKFFFYNYCVPLSEARKEWNFYMEEYIDVLDESGNYTGKSKERGSRASKIIYNR